MGRAIQSNAPRFSGTPWFDNITQSNGFILSDKLKVQNKDEPGAEPQLRVLPEPNAKGDGGLLDSLESIVEYTLRSQGPRTKSRFLEDLADRLRGEGVEGPRVVSTPYL